MQQLKHSSSKEVKPFRYINEIWMGGGGAQWLVFPKTMQTQKIKCLFEL